MKKISILHISDIHKAEGADFDLLYASLEEDRQRWIDEGVKNPDYIVLSGDIIQGAHTEDEIRNQYLEAETLLNKLTNLYLNGDKERFIIVPGNHDVNRHCTNKAIEGVIELSKKNMKSYYNDNACLRLDYDNKVLKYITDADAYDKRFELFREFYDRFFDGIRAYPKDPVNEVSVIPFPHNRICFVCFNSCNMLDHLNTAGDISDEAIDAASKDTERMYKNGYLTVGVWHHNTYGDPYLNGYMRKDILRDLQSINIRVGLFGHQHYSQTAEDYSSDLHSEGDRDSRMLVISSGTLYGEKEATWGKYHRQYNIVEFDMNNQSGYADVSINVREDRSEGNHKPYFAPTDSVLHYKVTYKKSDEYEIVREIAEYANKTGEYGYSILRLQNETEASPQTQKLINEYAGKLTSEEIVKYTPSPLNPSHCIQLIGAIRDTRNEEAFERLANDPHIEAFLDADSFIKEQYSDLVKFFEKQ